MIRISGATWHEKSLIKKVEKATFRHLNQQDFFVIDMTIVDEATIKDLNSSARGVDKVTDVLSFPCFDGLELPVAKDKFSFDDYDGNRVLLGSIMICRKRAEEQAVEYGHSVEREIGFLTVHGLLHLLGFDHIEEADEKVMRAHQTQILELAGLGIKG